MNVTDQFGARVEAAKFELREQGSDVPALLEEMFRALLAAEAAVAAATASP